MLKMWYVIKTAVKAATSVERTVGLLHGIESVTLASRSQVDSELEMAPRDPAGWVQIALIL